MEQTIPNPEQPGSPEEEAHDSFSPSGTFVFVLLMLLGYAIYWAYLWFIVVLERG